MREQPKIPEEQLRACFQDQYDLYPVTLEFLPLGLDYNAGVYRVVGEQGTAYLLKSRLDLSTNHGVWFLAISTIRGLHRS